jgi:hypothetical protein
LDRGAGKPRLDAVRRQERLQELLHLGSARFLDKLGTFFGLLCRPNVCVTLAFTFLGLQTLLPLAFVLHLGEFGLIVDSLNSIAQRFACGGRWD